MQEFYDILLFKGDNLSYGTQPQGGSFGWMGMYEVDRDWSIFVKF